MRCIQFLEDVFLCDRPWDRSFVSECAVTHWEQTNLRMVLGIKEYKVPIEISAPEVAMEYQLEACEIYRTYIYNFFKYYKQAIFTVNLFIFVLFSL